MSNHEFSSPQLNAIAESLRHYASENNVATGDDRIAFVRRYTTDEVRREGHALADITDHEAEKYTGRTYNVSRDIPLTIPLLLGRLAMYDKNYLNENEGVGFNKVRWLRLVNTGLNHPRVGEVMSIVGAPWTPDQPVLIDLKDGDFKAFTQHPFADADYAVTATEETIGDSRLPMTIIDIALPNVDYRP